MYYVTQDSLHERQLDTWYTYVHKYLAFDHVLTPSCFFALILLLTMSQLDISYHSVCRNARTFVCIYL